MRRRTFVWLSRDNSSHGPDPNRRLGLCRPRPRPPATSRSGARADRAPKRGPLPKSFTGAKASSLIAKKPVLSGWHRQTATATASQHTGIRLRILYVGVFESGWITGCTRLSRVPTESVLEKPAGDAFASERVGTIDRTQIGDWKRTGSERTKCQSIP